MEYHYELIDTDIGVPVNIFVHAVDELKMHWHRHMEILLVLKGSINIRIGEEEYPLRENDLILINSNEIHSTSRTNEENILLALQIDCSHYDRYFNGFSSRVFDCKSFHHDHMEQDRFDIIRYYMAQLVWELNKKSLGHSFKLVSILNLLAEHLLNNFPNEVRDLGSLETMNMDMQRISNIVNYIDNNFEKGISLQELADMEELNVYYLSHYIKKALGISFQEYLNSRRLERAMTLLITTNKTITDIALESGFPSTKSLNNFFRSRYDMTPTQYRRDNKDSREKIYNLSPNGDKKVSKSYFDVNRTDAFAKLFTYLNLEDVDKGKKDIIEGRTVDIDLNIRGRENNFYWQNLTTFGRAAEGLRKNVQEQLRELQREIGFKYIRFHGIFSDEMMIYNIDDKGNVVYNWSYVDELFDFFKEVNIKPFVELGFMPSEIKKSDENIFWWKANISPPKDINLWTDLVKEFIKHCINRYGLKEVGSWYFEVWNEPELEYVFWAGNREEFFKFYEETYLAVKSISENLKVGGPAITHQSLKDGDWLEDFLTYCKDSNLPLDFVSLHIYPEDYSIEEEEEYYKKVHDGISGKEMMALFQSMKKIYYDENHTLDTLESANKRIKDVLLYNPELHITEWSATAGGRNLISDTTFVSTYIIKNILEAQGQVDSLGYWTFTDIMEESKAGISHFHGGFGLMNKEGLKKPGYYAYYLLSKLGREIIEQGEDYIVTKDGDDIQILVYNFAYFDDLFMKGDTSALTNLERYTVFEEKPTIELNLHLKGISGNYKETRYKLNRETGSVYDQWIKMGSPEDMTKEEIAYLDGISRPNMTVKYIEAEDNYVNNLVIPVHGVELIVLEKQI